MVLRQEEVANLFLHFFNIFRRILQDQKFILHVLHKEREEKAKDDVCFQFMLNYVRYQIGLQANKIDQRTKRARRTDTVFDAGEKNTVTIFKTLFKDLLIL